ncbi:zinc finger BED domain-containing protein 4-like [Myxocyprinus asiaticus]|uniref:zinc finger BED domain-containing protein 4-like n=1 Tax=Myxocyprinus asiaticus TaxID=70543 RepID=UPI002221DED8|nr:zinc finger BED domain-containing protein 4-like [Myxocyprinus asiaticus]
MLLKDGRIDHALNMSKKVVGCFSYTWRRRSELSEAQKELKLPEHKLKTEFPTRWRSKQAMIARVLEQQSAISCVLSMDKKVRHLVPTWQDIEVLEAVNNSLSPLAEFTDALSGEQYVSVSYVKPVLHLFNNTIFEEKEGETELSKCIKRKILDYLNKKYDDPQTEEVLDMASVVDPRFKDRVEAVKIHLRTEMASIYTFMKPQPSVTVCEEADDQNTPALKKTK